MENRFTTPAKSPQIDVARRGPKRSVCDVQQAAENQRLPQEVDARSDAIPALGRTRSSVQSRARRLRPSTTRGHGVPLHGLSYLVRRPGRTRGSRPSRSLRSTAPLGNCHAIPLLTHWAPASGNGVEPSIREGVQHTGRWQPLGPKTAHAPQFRRVRWLRRRSALYQCHATWARKAATSSVLPGTA